MARKWEITIGIILLIIGTILLIAGYCVQSLHKEAELRIINFSVESPYVHLVYRLNNTLYIITKYGSIITYELPTKIPLDTYDKDCWWSYIGGIIFILIGIVALTSSKD